MSGSTQVSDAIHLSRRTLAKIKQNLAWAFGYNVISIPLAAGVLLPTMGICLTPSISGALMGMSSVMVVGNSLLLQLEMQRDFSHGGIRGGLVGRGSGDDKQVSELEPVQGGQRSLTSRILGLASAARFPLGAVSLEMDGQVTGRG